MGRTEKDNGYEEKLMVRTAEDNGCSEKKLRVNSGRCPVSQKRKEAGNEGSDYGLSGYNGAESGI
ncbi:hypothetical protein BRYFOR_06647 [Marvinbryantia formatexigens DSM 14469]|uniref:Uncharacterized protein n=1 Tax=Marvinbryantia formatexigens DSM 14469 TaxID=478749 RepID=C6LCY9_9FIRM|nr:hypothetical protein [Marvinbryantia formatexigens]EET61472.1 hypothetical protein BRYFOR_06647 [Marvinbryantia formatexigens DSM 14469]UWO26133.1 hypothetical protein NQ534_06605 [Marvinbryantia formatexigens DSM 14469]